MLQQSVKILLSDPSDPEWFPENRPVKETRRDYRIRLSICLFLSIYH